MRTHFRLPKKIKLFVTYLETQYKCGGGTQNIWRSNQQTSTAWTCLDNGSMVEWKEVVQ